MLKKNFIITIVPISWYTWIRAWFTGINGEFFIIILIWTKTGNRVPKRRVVFKNLGRNNDFTRNDVGRDTGRAPVDNVFYLRFF